MALLIGALSIASIATVIAISYSVQPTLSPLASTISIDMVAYDKGGEGVNIRHKSRGPLSPETGSTIIIFTSNITPDEIVDFRRKDANILYDLRNLVLEKMLAKVDIKLVYWGTAISWEPTGTMTFSIKGPSGNEYVLDTFNAHFPKIPPESTEMNNVVEIPIPIDKSLWLEGDGRYTLRFYVNVDITIVLDGYIVNHGKGEVEGIINLEIYEGQPFLRAVSVAKDSIFKVP